MKTLQKEQVEQCKAAIHMVLSKCPEHEQSQVTFSSLIKAMRESPFPGMNDLTMSQGTFRKHFGTISDIKKRYNMKTRSDNWPIERREKIREVFYEILSTLEPEEIVRVTLKDLRSMAIERHPHLLIESKGLTTLRQYFQITELKRSALSSKSTCTAILPCVTPAAVQSNGQVNAQLGAHADGSEQM